MPWTASLPSVLLLAQALPGGFDAPRSRPTTSWHCRHCLTHPLAVDSATSLADRVNELSTTVCQFLAQAMEVLCVSTWPLSLCHRQEKSMPWLDSGSQRMRDTWRRATSVTRAQSRAILVNSQTCGKNHLTTPSPTQLRSAKACTV